MKDKLYKTNHKKNYYSLRKIIVGSLLLFGASISIITPTYFSLNGVQLQNLHAEETTQTEEIDQQNDQDNNSTKEEDNPS